jgi:hypothetical protein
VSKPRVCVTDDELFVALEEALADLGRTEPLTPQQVKAAKQVKAEAMMRMQAVALYHDYRPSEWERVN